MKVQSLKRSLEIVDTYLTIAIIIQIFYRSSTETNILFSQDVFFHFLWNYFLVYYFGTNIRGQGREQRRGGKRQVGDGGGTALGWKVRLQNKFQTKIQILMFKTIGNLCQASPCFLKQEKSQQIEVPPFFQIQQQINQLPTFESQCLHPGVSQLPTSPRNSTQLYHQTSTPVLKRIKSQPNCLTEPRPVTEKENSRVQVRSKYRQNTNILHSQAVHQPFVRIRYEPQQKSTNAPTNHDLPKSQSRSQHLQNRPIVTASYSAMGTPQRRSDYKDNVSTPSVVSVDEFNRVVNMNKNLIKMIQEDYRPLQASVSQLKQGQQERVRLIQVLQEKVRGLREQVGNGKNQDMPVKRFY